MIRFLNLLALIAVIASAVSAYTVKYETIIVAEKLRKFEAELQRERDAVTILKAEWQLLNRPARLQAIAAPEAGMQTMSMRQAARAQDIPQRGPESDTIGSRIDGLLTGSIPSPAPARKTSGRTPPGAMPKAATTTPGKAQPKQAKADGARPPRTAGPVRIVPPANLGQTKRAEGPPPASGIGGLFRKIFGQGG